MSCSRSFFLHSQRGIHVCLLQASGFLLPRIFRLSSFLLSEKWWRCWIEYSFFDAFAILCFANAFCFGAVLYSRGQYATSTNTNHRGIFRIVWRTNIILLYILNMGKKYDVVDQKKLQGRWIGGKRQFAYSGDPRKPSPPQHNSPRIHIDHLTHATAPKLSKTRIERKLSHGSNTSLRSSVSTRPGNL